MYVSNITAIISTGQLLDDYSLIKVEIVFVTGQCIYGKMDIGHIYEMSLKIAPSIYFHGNYKGAITLFDRENMTGYWWEGSGSTAIPPTPASDHMG